MEKIECIKGIYIKKIHIVLMPYVIILAGWLTATLFNRIIGPWAFIPVAMAYWGLIAYTTKLRFKELKQLFVVAKDAKKLNIVAYIPPVV